MVEVNNGDWGEWAKWVLKTIEKDGEEINEVKERCNQIDVKMGRMETTCSHCHVKISELKTIVLERKDKDTISITGVVKLCVFAVVSGMVALTLKYLFITIKGAP